MKTIFIYICALLLTLTANVFGQNAVLQCQTQIKAKQYEEALKTCDEAARNDPKTGNLGKGLAYAGLFDWSNAIKVYTDMIDGDPRSAEAFVNRGLANYNAGNFKAAYEDLSQASRIEPRFAPRLQPHIDAAREVAELLPVKKATPDITKRSLTASLAANDLLIGRALKKLNKEPQINIDMLDRQIADKIDEAVRINRYNSHAYSIRAGLFEAQGQNPKALIEYTKAVALDPFSAGTVSNRGKLYMKVKSYNPAASDFTKAIELAGTRSSSYYTDRSDAYEKMGMQEKALQDLTKVIELEPKNAFGYNMRASYYERQKENVKALADLNNAVAVDPKDASSRLARCRLFNENKNFNAAAADCTVAIEQKSFIISDSAMYERAVAYTGSKKYDLAFADLSKAEASKMVSLADIFAQRGVIFDAQGKKADAVAAFNAALKEDPNNRKALDGLKGRK